MMMVLSWFCSAEETSPAPPALKEIGIEKMPSYRSKNSLPEEKIIPDDVAEIEMQQSVSMVAKDERGVWQRAVALTLDARFMRPPISEPFANARDTVLSVSVVEPSGETKWLAAEDFERFGGTLEQLLPATVALTTKLLEKHPPRFERDRDGVIRYGVIEGQSSFIASVLLAPGFLALFRDTIGPVLEVVIPSRNKIFVFPSGEASEHEEMLWREFRGAFEPVSLEVFEVSKSGTRAIATFRP